MKASETWHVWRRILREPALADAVVAGTVAQRAHEFGLDPAQARIAAEYAANGDGVKWAIEGYQYRLTRVTRHAVAEGAPLTASALEQLGHDLPALATAFVEDSGWTDWGPYVYRTTTAYLDYLEHTLKQDGAAAEALFDLVRLERAGARLVALHADGPEGSDSAATVDCGADLRWTGRGAVVRVERDIMGWLGNPRGHDLAAAEQHTQTFLVRLDGSKDHYTFTAIGDAAALAIGALARGTDVEGTAALLGVGPSDDGLRQLVATLTSWDLLANLPVSSS
ncbi:hypothetical protein NC315_39515 [Streptomyces sp. G2]|uniref:hypothetical protein n=1 Tax=Streptomyces TaxID=1883 RepID=UPI00202DE373|nr:hypothetical protein [Streptomyces sp. G2]MCM1951396.1 hypothetical protein [Streptomyces sp. G2]